MRGSRASNGRPRLANLTVAPELRLEGINSGWYQSQGSRNGIICRVQRLIMLAREVGVQVTLLSTGAHCSHRVGRLHRQEEDPEMHSGSGEF